MSLRSAIAAFTARLGGSRKAVEANPVTHQKPPKNVTPLHPEAEPDLMARLSREHGQLRMVMGNVLNSAQRGKFDAARKELVRFQSLLARHLATENRDFYPQLKEHLPEYTGNIQRCQADLHGIITELRLLTEIGEQEAQWRPSTASSVKRLFERVKERLTYEENSLFPVYHAIGERQDIFNKTQIFDRSLYARLKSQP